MIVGDTDVNLYSDHADEDLDGTDEDADVVDADGRFCARQQLGNGRRLRSLPWRSFHSRHNDDVDGNDNHHFLDPVGPGEDYTWLFWDQTRPSDWSTGLFEGPLGVFLDPTKAMHNICQKIRGRSVWLEHLNILDHLGGSFL